MSDFKEVFEAWVLTRSREIKGEEEGFGTTAMTGEDDGMFQESAFGEARGGSVQYMSPDSGTQQVERQ